MELLEKEYKYLNMFIDEFENMKTEGTDCSETGEIK